MRRVASASNFTKGRAGSLHLGRSFALACLVLVPVLVALGLPVQRGMAAGPAEFLIVANAHVPVTAVDKEFLSRAFLKKVKTWSNDIPIEPVDLDPKSAVRDRFSRRVLGRSVGAVRSYWQQVLFSGRDVPPPELDHDDAVLRFVRDRSGGIGYVSFREDLRVDGVKVLVVR